jgi:hypothetical protein
MPEMNTAPAEALSMSRRENRRRRSDSTPDTASDRRTAAPEPDRQAIETRAYELYLERGGGDGDDVNDWLRAEQELNLR